jgi:hypothetical protein
MTYKKRLSGDRDQICSCGQHRGKGTTSPYQLAQIYAWFKDFRPDDVQVRRDGGCKYLQSYEEKHGRVQQYIYGADRPFNK